MATATQNELRYDVSLPEYCRLMRLTWPQAWRRVLTGEVRALKIRGRWFIAREDVRDTLPAA